VPRSLVEQAGAVVFRRSGRGLRVLVVSSRHLPGRWLFPKGHIDKGEKAGAAALREAGEEAGVVGTVIQRLDPALEFRYAGKNYRVRYFVIEWTGATVAEDGRECLWLTPDRARRKLSDASARKLLDGALKAIASTGTG